MNMDDVISDALKTIAENEGKEPPQEVQSDATPIEEPEITVDEDDERQHGELSEDDACVWCEEEPKREGSAYCSASCEETHANDFTAKQDEISNNSNLSDEDFARKMVYGAVTDYTGMAQLHTYIVGTCTSCGIWKRSHMSIGNLKPRCPACGKFLVLDDDARVRLGRIISGAESIGWDTFLEEKGISPQGSEVAQSEEEEVKEDESLPPKPPTEAEVDLENYSPLGEFKKSENSTIVLQEVEYKGEKYYDLREYVTGENYSGPTKRGVRFHSSILEGVASLLSGQLSPDTVSAQSEAVASVPIIPVADGETLESEIHKMCSIILGGVTCIHEDMQTFKNAALEVSEASNEGSDIS
jgi:hypothetical protein